MRTNKLWSSPLAWMVATFLIGAVASGLFAGYQMAANTHSAQTTFEALADDVVERLQQRVQLYEYGLRGARAVVVTAGEGGINQRLFRQYYETRNFDQEFPGARGFGFIRKVPRPQTEPYLQARRAGGLTGFSIKTLNEHSDDRFVIEYIEPYERNRMAQGLDIGSEANRRQAAISAMQTGKATITGPITLIQASGDPQRSVLFLLPIYRGGTTPEGIDNRESMGFGWAYAPLALSEVLADFNITQLQYDLSITDVSNPSQPDPVFNSQRQRTPVKTTLQQTLEREIYGRLWRFELSARPEFTKGLDQLSWRTVLAVGMVTSLLMSLLVGAVRSGLERKRKILQQQAQLATIMESSADAIVGESTQGKVIIWNPAAERLFGYTRDEAMGQPMIERMTAVDEKGKEEQLVMKVMSKGDADPVDMTLLAKDGVLAPVSVTASAIRSERGQIIGIARFMRDIRDRQRAEKAMADLASSLEKQVASRTADLESARHDLQTVLDSVPSMIGYWDKDLRNRVANKAYSDWFGVEPSSLLGIPMVQLLGADMFERNRPYIEGALRGERQKFERSIPRPDGMGSRHSLANYLPDIVNGEVRGFYVIVHDITDIVASRQAFARDQRQLLAKMQIASRSLMGIINDVLDISKIEAGEMTTESVVFSPAELLTELFQLYSPQASNKGVSIELKGVNVLPAALLGDPTRLRQVLSNLLSNAIKFTSQGSVSLRVAREQNPGNADPHVWLEFSVVDTGEGISETALKGLFTPFAQADASTTRRFGGTGLGLSIVKRLCELMGGEVGAHSTVGAGSTFRVRLPFAVADEEDLSGQSVSSQRRLSIFIVDDNELDRVNLVQMGEAFGWRTTALNSGTELVHRMQELADAHQPLPDALVVDWKMPGLDGIQALIMLTERIGNKDLPATLVVSAQERDHVASHDPTGVVNRILTKPVNPSSLFNAINASVAERTGRQDHVVQFTRLEAIQGQWLQGMRILLVDDSDINLEVASQMLKKEGATVEVCVNGQDALLALTAMKGSGTSFDAVLMDIQMPVMDGYEATRRARHQLGLIKLPIIALTAGALTEERRRAEAAGMDAFLTKPLDPALLVRTVHAQVTRARGTTAAVALAEPAGYQSTSAHWPDIEGIRAEDAKRLMQGDVGLFTNLLQRFLRDYSDGFPPTTDSANTQEHDALVSRVHKLRGSSGMLGATRLHAIASQLETLLREGDGHQAADADETTDAAALLASLNDALRQLSAAAEAALASDARPPTAPGNVGSAERTANHVSESTLQAVQDLRRLLDRQDLAAIKSFENLAPDLLSLMGPQAMESLSHAVHSLDFAAAACTLSNVLTDEA